MVSVCTLHTGGYVELWHIMRTYIHISTISRAANPHTAKTFLDTRGAGCHSAPAPDQLTCTHTSTHASSQSRSTIMWRPFRVRIRNTHAVHAQALTFKFTADHHAHTAITPHTPTARPAMSVTIGATAPGASGAMAVDGRRREPTMAAMALRGLRGCTGASSLTAMVTDSHWGGL